MQFNTCYECPNYSHKGAFGNPRYKPACKGKPLPMLVDGKNHASPDHAKINCPELKWTKEIEIKQVESEKEIRRAINTEHKSNTATEIRDLWQTPKFVFDYYDKRFGFVTDLAASDDNHLCNHYYTESNSAFGSEIVDFHGAVWCNPPYSNIMPWVGECMIKSERAMKPFVMLLPADTSVKWFKAAFKNCTECHFISGRLSFINAETQKPVSGNNKGSVVFIFDPNSPVNQSVHLIDRDEMK